MDIFSEIEAYSPFNKQEENDKAVLLGAMRQYPDTILLRENPLAHITSSGFILTPGLNKALLIHHNLLATWAWTGGHADGERNLLAVALREAAEETGIVEVRPLSGKIAALDILPVPAHFKNGQYVNAHLHLSVAYLLVCDEAQTIRIKPDENSGVRWFGQEEFTEQLFNTADLQLYHKLFARARE